MAMRTLMWPTTGQSQLGEVINIGCIDGDLTGGASSSSRSASLRQQHRLNSLPKKERPNIVNDWLDLALFWDLIWIESMINQWGQVEREEEGRERSQLICILRGA